MADRAADTPADERLTLYLSFKRNANKAEGKKTYVWDVFSSSRGFLLGEIRWFGRWRQYAFFPVTETLYNPKCLREIADFMEEETRWHAEQIRQRGNRPAVNPATRCP